MEAKRDEGKDGAMMVRVVMMVEVEVETVLNERARERGSCQDPLRTRQR